MEVPNMTREAQNRRRCRAIERWIISWIGLKSGKKKKKKLDKDERSSLFAATLSTQETAP
jgi:hypothetical protein